MRASLYPVLFASRRGTLRPVATRSAIPDLKGFSGSSLYVFSRTKHYAPSALTSIKIAVANWYINLSQTSLAEGSASSTMVTEASIEYLGGTIVPLTWSGASTGTIADGATGYSDYAAVNIPQGYFWVRIETHMPETAGNVGLFTQSPANTALGEMTWLQNSTSGGVTGAVPGDNVGSSYSRPPAAILGLSTNRAFALLGDSRTEGSGYEENGTYADKGEIAPGLNNRWAYINMGVGNDRADKFLLSHTRRLELASLCTDWVDGYGVNDFSAGGRTSAQLLADYASIRALAPAGTTHWAYTLPPFAVTGTYATLVGQTVDANDAARRVAFNNSLRAGIAGTTVLEAADVLESSRDSGKWRVDLGALTADGTHENRLGASTLKAGITGLIS